MNEPLLLRPHHGLCLRHFIGKGYNREFVETMTAVSEELKQSPFRQILLQSEADILCASCPHNHDGVCDTTQKVAHYDEKCLALCGLHNGQKMPHSEFDELIQRKILKPRRLSDVCGDCSWRYICQNSCSIDTKAVRNKDCLLL